MSGMYDQPPSSDVPESSMSAYPSVGRGRPVGRAVDPVGFLNAGEQRAREMQVEIETVKLLRQDVIR